MMCASSLRLIGIGVFFAESPHGEVVIFADFVLNGMAVLFLDLFGLRDGQAQTVAISEVMWLPPTASTMVCQTSPSM